MKNDGRTWSHETTEAIRRIAVQRVQKGERPSDVMKSYGLCRTTIYRWLRAHKKGGGAALASRRGTPGLADEQTKATGPQMDMRTEPSAVRF